MSAFIILALALAVMAIAVSVVVARELLRNLRKLSAQVRATNERLLPLSDELQGELAVTSVEVEGLTRSLEQLQKQRARPSRRKRTRRSR